MNHAEDRLPNPETTEVEPPRPNRETPIPDGKEVKKPEPTRYGDWEKNGRCIDF